MAYATLPGIQAGRRVRDIAPYTGPAGSRAARVAMINTVTPGEQAGNFIQSSGERKCKSSKSNSHLINGIEGFDHGGLAIHWKLTSS
ncbi:hypothetical protein ACIPC1_25430 [Streptomyces sp. NPDC087263]|uniref:hypothetical protein n=1 Tax=Streptomyces sp. NPDC087263 TaxID=3365773 RepID=UPI00380C2A52